MKRYNLNFEGYWREDNFSGVPSSSGVYSFMECKYDPYNKSVSLKRLLYIGKADDLNDRINNHDKIDQMKRSLSPGNELCVNISKVSTDIDRIENALIYHHKPPFNDQLKNSFNYDTTTISNSGRYSLLTQLFTVYKTTSSIYSRRIY